MSLNSKNVNGLTNNVKVLLFGLLSAVIVASIMIMVMPIFILNEYLSPPKTMLAIGIHAFASFAISVVYSKIGGGKCYIASISGAVLWFLMSLICGCAFYNGDSYCVIETGIACLIGGISGAIMLKTRFNRTKTVKYKRKR